MHIALFPLTTENFLFNVDSSPSGPSLSLWDVWFSFTFFLHLLQPKVQHCILSLPISVVSLQQLYQESGHSNMALIEFRGLHFLMQSNPGLLYPVLYFRSVICTFGKGLYLYRHWRWHHGWHPNQWHWHTWPSEGEVPPQGAGANDL